MNKKNHRFFVNAKKSTALFFSGRTAPPIHRSTVRRDFFSPVHYCRVQFQPIWHCSSCMPKPPFCNNCGKLLRKRYRLLLCADCLLELSRSAHVTIACYLRHCVICKTELLSSSCAAYFCCFDCQCTLLGKNSVELFGTHSLWSVQAPPRPTEWPNC